MCLNISPDYIFHDLHLFSMCRSQRFLKLQLVLLMFFFAAVVILKIIPSDAVLSKVNSYQCEGLDLLDQASRFHRKVLSTHDSYNTTLTKRLQGSNETVIVRHYLHNITRADNNKLFQVIQDDHIHESNWTNYKHNFEAKNELNYTFLITGEDICTNDAPHLLIIIPSVVNDVGRRDLLRKTWLRASETNSWPRKRIQHKVKHIFLFGYRSKRLESDWQLLSRESLLNNDIIMADFEDSYRNLTVKILVGLKWTLKYCNKVQYVLKVDMDTFINVPIMMNLLQYVQNNTSSATFVIGLLHSYKKPLVVRKESRWKVSENEYPLPFYPRYLYGHTYGISRTGIDTLVHMSEKISLIAPEDAFITGILPKLAGVLRLTAPSFTACCKKLEDCQIVWDNKVSATQIKTNERFEKLWSNIVTNSCEHKDI
ncbi:beta-1,3-galactosyltransferase 5 [Biomphalaria glabrata]|nr:beta-1,3-galactosyltransferase 5 [Biomphalaria glabrata]